MVKVFDDNVLNGSVPAALITRPPKEGRINHNNFKMHTRFVLNRKPENISYITVSMISRPRYMLSVA